MAETTTHQPERPCRNPLADVPRSIGRNGLAHSLRLPRLTAADICLFIARVKIGTYGPFYGSITPLKIMEFLRQYTSECRKSKSSAIPSAATPAPEADERKPVTYEVYQETLRKAKAGDPEAIRELERPPGK